ncbi:type II toxin-antitoxin system YoeB family toxin [Accumulibacter sp.]
MRHTHSGRWSRRVVRQHRFVYRIKDDCQLLA